jgi:hypothetical protein
LTDASKAHAGRAQSVRLDCYAAAICRLKAAEYFAFVKTVLPNHDTLIYLQVSFLMPQNGCTGFSFERDMKCIFEM